MSEADGDKGPSYFLLVTGRLVLNMISTRF